MFDSFLGRKFSNKCKHSVKCIKCRMETIRKKKHAMVRYLKKDVADLVSSGHDANAFGRMDALFSEINQASCYDMIEQYCCCILEHLPTMRKERVCPEETVEAVATLIFAAARFPDLPELADLRRGFTVRYGTSMESYTNSEFVEKMQQKSFSQDKKLQLMQDIAQEFMVDWDVKSFEYKISNPSSPSVDHPKIQFLSSNITDGRREVTDRRNVVVNGRNIILKQTEATTYLALQKQQIEFEKLKTGVINEDQKIIQMSRDEHHSRSSVQKQQVQPEEPRNFHTTPKNANAHPHNSTEKIKKVAADESENIEPHQFGNRTPNVKTKGNQNGNYVQDLICEGNTHKRSESVHEAIDMFPPHTKLMEDFTGTSSFHDGFVHSTTEEVVKEMEHNGQRMQPNGAVNSESKRASNLKPPYVKPNVKNPMETSSVKPTNYEMYRGGDNGDDHKNAPFSVRRKHLEQGTAASTGEDGNLPGKIPSRQAGGNMQQGFSWKSKQIEDDTLDGAIYLGRDCHKYRTYSDQPRHERRSITANGGCDKEEVIMNKVLRHYSKKDVSNEPEKAKTGTREPQTQIHDSARVPEQAIEDEQYSKLWVHTQTRTSSLLQTETLVRRHMRSVSMQPDLLSPNGGCVHPRLPDYDDLAARFAALRKS